MEDKNSDSIADRLRDYLESTSSEEVQKAWDQVESLGLEGPTVEEYVEYLKHMNLQRITSSEQFNKKYEKYLESGFYGLDIDNQEVLDYLDREFEKEIESNPNFQYSQIKTKFGYARVYLNSSSKDQEWEQGINGILKIKTDLP